MLERVDTAVQNEKISPATGKPLKKHEKAGLKFLKEEQEDKFWEEATYWNNERFSEPKWKEELRRIGQLVQEHKLIEFGWHPSSPPPPKNCESTSGDRQLLLQSWSSLTAPTGAHPLRPAHLPRIDTGSSTTPRPRWDVVTSGPVTPLSATAGPIKNAFAEGGFWASLTPKTSSLAGDSVPATPITAIPVEHVALPPTDPEARAAYDSVNQEVNAMALQLCASRLALRRSTSADYDVIHPAMVKPRDTRLAAEFTLSALQCPLPTLESICLPEKLDRFASEELEVLRQFSVPSMEKLRDIDAWLLFDDKTGMLSTILEAQRDNLKMNRYRRKEKEVTVNEQAARLAWAVKILGDKESIKEGDDSDEDEIYEYGNIMRSLENGTTTTEEVDNGVRNRILQRSASSPIKPTPGSLPITLRSRQASHTFSNSPRPAARYPTASGSLSHSHATKNRPAHLSINSTLDTHAEKVLSPQDRGVRRQGPSIEDLSFWADELKMMERKRTEMKLAGRWNAGEDAYGRQQRFEDGAGEAGVRNMIVGGSVHPAFRSWADNDDDGGGREGMEDEEEDSTISSTSTMSWVCKTANVIERNAHALRKWDEGQNRNESKGEGEGEAEGEDIDEKTPTGFYLDPTHRQQEQSPFPPLRPLPPSPYKRHLLTSHERRFALPPGPTSPSSPSSPSQTALPQPTTTPDRIVTLPHDTISPSTPRTISKHSPCPNSNNRHVMLFHSVYANQETRCMGSRASAYGGDGEIEAVGCFAIREDGLN